MSCRHADSDDLRCLFSGSAACPCGTPITDENGAILLTGYLGGAVSLQLRIGAPLFSLVFPVHLGVMLWGGLYLRNAPLRTLIPLRR